MPCFVADHESIARLQAEIERAPATLVEAHVDTGYVTAGPLRIQATLPPALRDAFLSGQWNPTSLLLARFDEVTAVANRLPYVTGF
jgi:hypothetical protein